MGVLGDGVRRSAGAAWVSASAVMAVVVAAHAVPSPPPAGLAPMQSPGQAPAGGPGTPARDEPAGTPASVSGPSPAWCDHVVELSARRRSGVVTARLANGVLVHHRRVERSAGQVDVTITLQGGESLEDAGTRGLTQVLASVMDDYAAAAPLAAPAARLDRRDAHVDASGAADSLQLRVWGAAADLDAMLSVAAELLTSPRITPEGVEAAKEAVIAEARRREGDHRAAVGDAVVDAIFPKGEARARPVDERQVRGVTPERVRAWAERHLSAGGAPVEVGVSGDIPLEAALRVVDARLGGLPARAAPARLEIAGAPRRPAGPVTAESRSPQVGRKAAVVRGCFAPDLDATGDLRALRVAARVLTDRLKKKLAPAAFGAGPDGPGASVLLSVYPGFGMLAASASVEDSQAERAGREMEEELARLADGGPEPEEVAQAAGALAKIVEGFERDPRYWSGMLSRSVGLGLDPDMVVDGPAAYRAMDAARVRDVLARYARPESRVSVTVRPVGE